MTLLMLAALIVGLVFILRGAAAASLIPQGKRQGSNRPGGPAQVEGDPEGRPQNEEDAERRKGIKRLVIGLIVIVFALFALPVVYLFFAYGISA
ncbi:hypothetical protein [Saccharibacillus alkalitolerans]|uniref:Uncharacterized protein n=1 Tax=Saccharibacillus alkalitolerans TaxID=2705290 RepID=A0ABX0F633_9BACL|nr:hypothetical protein [Saccharibacillus alkalitolerans]NGZ76417.1 hypothetical protein [Saccharibacillus alkalitolerans]